MECAAFRRFGSLLRVNAAETAENNSAGLRRTLTGSKKSLDKVCDEVSDKGRAWAGRTGPKLLAFCVG
jgi:hypothetical protein